MFLHVCVILFTGEGGFGVPDQAPPQDQAGTPPGPGRNPPDQGGTPQTRPPPGPGRNPPEPGRNTPPKDQAGTPPGPGRYPPQPADSGIRSTFGRYASYWNASLFRDTFSRLKVG